MPRLSELTRKPDWVTDETPSVPLSNLQQLLSRLPAESPQVPGASPVIRCPFPAMGTVNPDSIRQFYNNPAPKFRVFTNS
jgi:hypothetical protein